MVQLSILCFCLPTLLLAAPVEDAIKQQIAGAMRNEEPYWTYLAPSVGGSMNLRPTRVLDSLGGTAFGLQKRFDTLGGKYFGHQKRNFDEIDNAGFGAFVKKNFDEIDNVGMGFKKRNFDEIDNAGFGAFIKRSK